MNRTALLIVGAIVILGGAYYLFAMPAPDTAVNPTDPDGDGDVHEETEGMMAEGTPEEEHDNDMVHEQTGTVESGTETTNDAGATVKEFNVAGTNFAFSVKEMRVKKGDTVRVNFKSESGFHDWVVDEFDARTKQLNAPGTETIEFVADKVGTFEYYCSVGQHRANGMVGKLIVEE